MFDCSWIQEDGTHDGGVSYGPGFCIAWQRGPRDTPTGAYPLDLLYIIEARLHAYQYNDDGTQSKYWCDENEAALGYVGQAIHSLEARQARRALHAHT